MKEIIRSVSDLPNWFDLEKYDGFSRLNASGWYEQLSVRRDLPFCLGIGSGREVSDRWMEELLPIIHGNPIVDIITEGPLRALFYGGPMDELRGLNPIYSRGVRLADVKDLYRAEAYICEVVQKQARKWASHYLGEKDNFLTPKPADIDLEYVASWIHRPIHKMSDYCNPIISLNMDLPDNVLIEGFKQLVKGMRDEKNENYHPIKKHSKPDFAGWVSFGVIPYIDLTLWANVAGVSIPNRVMADAIFAPGEGGEEVVRKTTAKFAVDLVTTGHLTQLAAYAAHEISERNMI